MLTRRTSPYVDLISELIEHKKIVIGLVNGPCVGIGMTMLCLFDLVLATDKVELKAYFLTPFTKIGLTAEGTSTYSYPAFMGRLRANRLLLFSEKIDANEAKELGLVTKVFPQAQFKQKCTEQLEALEKLAPGSMLAVKELLLGGVRKELRHYHQEEALALDKKYQGQEIYDFLIKSIKERKAKI